MCTAKALTQGNIHISYVLSNLSRKITGINSLFFRASKICSNSLLFTQQIESLKSFMSWNGFPSTIRNFLICKLKPRQSDTSHTCKQTIDDSLLKIWLNVPYLGKKGEFLVKTLIRKLKRHLKIHVNFIDIYQTKKTLLFHL